MRPPQAMLRVLYTRTGIRKAGQLHFHVGRRAEAQELPTLLQRSDQPTCLTSTIVLRYVFGDRRRRLPRRVLATAANTIALTLES